MSSTTPTTVNQGPTESAGPRLKRLHRQHRAEHAGAHRERHALGQVLAHDPGWARAERRPQGHVPRTAEAPRQPKVGDVDGRDQQNASHSGHQHPQGQTRLRSDDVTTQGNDSNAAVPLADRQLRVEAPSNRAHLRLRRFDGDVRPQPSDHEPRVPPPDPVAGLPVRKQRVGLEDVGIQAREPEPVGQHADDA